MNNIKITKSFFLQVTVAKIRRSTILLMIFFIFIVIYTLIIIFELFKGPWENQSYIFTFMICFGTFSLPLLINQQYILFLLKKFTGIRFYHLSDKKQLMEDLKKDHTHVDPIEFLNFDLKTSRLKIILNFLGLITSAALLITWRPFGEYAPIMAVSFILVIMDWWKRPVTCKIHRSKSFIKLNYVSNEDFIIAPQMYNFFDKEVVKEIIKRKRMLRIFEANYYINYKR